MCQRTLAMLTDELDVHPDLHPEVVSPRGTPVQRGGMRTSPHLRDVLTSLFWDTAPGLGGYLAARSTAAVA